KPSNVLGQGTTDANGNYVIQWFSPGTPPAAAILWKARQKDVRFEVRVLPSTGIYYAKSGSFSLTQFTTVLNPQKMSTWYWGSSQSPNAYANLYDGAWRRWHYALQYSGLMGSVFTGVKIDGFNATTCPTSCASGPSKTITIDSTTSAFEPQGRVMHE